MHPGGSADDPEFQIRSVELRFPLLAGAPFSITMNLLSPADPDIVFVPQSIDHNSPIAPGEDVTQVAITAVNAARLADGSPAPTQEQIVCLYEVNGKRA